MIPFVAILSTSDTVCLSAVFAPLKSLASSDARMDLSAERSLDRMVRLCSRRLMFCRFAFSADLVRLATFWRPLSREISQSYKAGIVPRPPGSLRLEDVERHFPLAISLPDPDADVESAGCRAARTLGAVGAPRVAQIARFGRLRKSRI